MLKIKKIGQLYAPVIDCDFCGELIEGGRKGVYLYPLMDENKEEKTTIQFAHKGNCHDQLEEELRDIHGVGHAQWNELDLFFAQLIDNAEIDIDAANDRDDRLGGLR